MPSWVTAPGVAETVYVQAGDPWQDLLVTSIVSWAAVDSRGVSAIYIASDSRITWGASDSWSQGRKTFATRAAPHIFGYWGDVLFPALALPIIVDQLDSAQIKVNPSRPYGAIGDAIRRLWLDYPERHRHDVGIIMGHRLGFGMRSSFDLAVMTYESGSNTWSRRSIPMPARSSELRIAGSGSRHVRAARKLWEESRHGGTSRAIFSAFCEALREGQDPLSGGGPQLVGLHRRGGALLFGTVFCGERYVAGRRVSKAEASRGDILWFNELFERVDGESMRRLPGAQRHSPR